MVGIFSRFSRTGHRRSQNALIIDVRGREDGGYFLMAFKKRTSKVPKRTCKRQLLSAKNLSDERQVLAPDAELAGSAAAATSHGIELAVEFKPVEHPIEPLSNDQPVKCPLPEPSILNDGSVWKERRSASVQRRADLPVMKEGAHLETEAAVTKARVRPSPVSRSSLPSSISAPERNIINLLEECKAAGD